ncbi:MAG TPA: M48 family metallopeptidase, partial [Albitalea sp.]|nr:M48 family metallopeptidase [Albitalea sp.]
YAYWLSAAALVFFWWLWQPHRELPGRRIERADAPALFDELDALAKALDAPRIDEIRLDDQLNAGALQTTARRRPWRSQRVLILGVPLLDLADKTTLRAVIAHELGHFSHKHHRLGHWIYRARVGWLAFATESSARDSLFERAASRFACWFGPWFARLSFPYSRHCEYQADAFSAELVGRDVAAGALVRVAALNERWSSFMGAGLTAHRQAHASAPSELSAVCRAAVLAAPLSPSELAALDQREAASDDTHPALRERVAALGLQVGATQIEIASHHAGAGSVWWRDWPSVISAHDAAWHGAQQRRWRRQHLRDRLHGQRLEQLRAGGDCSLEWARLELAVGDVSLVAELASSLIDQHSAEAHCLIGTAQLRLGQPAGFDALEQAIRFDPSWVLAARVVIESHARLLPDDHARKRNTALLAKARERRTDAGEALSRAIDAGIVDPIELDPVALDIVRQTLHMESWLAAAWLVQHNGLERGGRIYPNIVLMLRMDTAALHAAGLDEDEVANEGLALLRDVANANRLRRVWTCYTTEPMPPGLEARLSTLAAARVR